MSSELIELGQRALAAVSSSVANGASLIKCKLLACEFYEALRHELQNTPVTHSKRAKLIAAESRHPEVQSNADARVDFFLPLHSGPLVGHSCRLLRANAVQGTDRNDVAIPL